MGLRGLTTQPRGRRGSRVHPERPATPSPLVLLYRERPTPGRGGPGMGPSCRGCRGRTGLDRLAELGVDLGQGNSRKMLTVGFGTRDLPQKRITALFHQGRDFRE
jgi:hypothetical protein